METIFASPRSFGRAGKAPIEALEQAGYRVVTNPLGRPLSRAEMCAYATGAAGLIVGVDPVDADVLAACPTLRAVAKYGVGTDNIDLAACKSLGIPVSITRGANSEAVADYAFTLMAACARRLVQIDRQCHRGSWEKATALDIYGKTLGILGLGAIGRGVARRAQGFGMQVLAYDVQWDSACAGAGGITYAPPEELYRRSDFISLHLPLLPETRNMISDAELAMMKPTAVLVNTARGGLVDEAALVRALEGGTIFAAGLDVFCSEPPENPALYALDNLIMGSHCAASTQGAVAAMGMMAAENLLADLAPSR